MARSIEAADLIYLFCRGIGAARDVGVQAIWMAESEGQVLMETYARQRRREAVDLVLDRYEVCIESSTPDLPDLAGEIVDALERAEEHYQLALRDASLGVGHIWTDMACPAYRTYNPADCDCVARWEAREAR